MAQRSPRNKTYARIGGLSLVLFAVNAYVCRELFRIEYLRHMGSIEALFITLARYARDNWGDLTWFPFWYNGVPYQNTYPPFLPVLTTGVSVVFGWPPALAYHATVAFLYCAGPVLLFWMCYRLSRSIAFSFFAGLIHSVVAPTAFLIADVHRDLGGFLRPRRLQTLVIYGEGPHVAGLALLPLSILLLDLAIHKRRPQYYVLAALAFAATALTNWLAAAALVIAVASYLLAFAGLPFHRPLLVAAGVGLLGYAIAASWIPPSTIRTFQLNSQTIEGDYRQYARLLPVRALALLAALVLAKLALTKLRAAPALQFSSYFTIVTGAVAMAWEYARIVVVPQPHRYNTELELGVAVLVPFALQPLFGRASQNFRIAAACLCLVAAVPFAKEHRRYARYILQPIDIARRVEYKSAQWLRRNLPDRRVLVPGSTMFWLNAFTDTQQLGGADDQGTTNSLTRVANYVITTSDSTGERDAEISLTWLDVFGVDAIEIGGPNSGEVYKPFRNPAKFDGILKELWRDGGDVIYQVPHTHTSLAHVLSPADLPVRPPINGLDIDPLKPYVSALEDSALPVADLRWTSRHSAQIQANLQPGQVLSVQITHHPGWRAAVNGRIVRSYADALGQMVVDPGCRGPCTVDLTYDGGLEMRLARLLSWAALAGSGLWIAIGNYLRRRASI